MALCSPEDDRQFDKAALFVGPKLELLRVMGNRHFYRRTVLYTVKRALLDRGLSWQDMWRWF